jgi:tetratricopeptide (TPR) repeat protein
LEGDTLGALSAYRAAADRAPRNPAYLIDIARIHRFRDENDASAAALAQAESLDPHDPLVFDGLGLLALESGDLAAAAARFQQSVDVDARYAPGYGHLGWTYFARQEWEQAAAAFRRAIDEGATNAEYLYELGLSLAYLGDCEAARPWLERGLAADPTSEAALKGLELCK